MAVRNRSGKEEEVALGSRLVIGAIAGFAATLAITATMRRLRSRGVPARAKPLTPGEGIGLTASARSPDIELLVQFAYGAGCGAVMGALDPKIGRAGGALAGATIWLTAYMGWLPALGRAGPKAGRGLRREAASLAAHVSWGVSTAQAIRELSAARATMVSDGSGKGFSGTAIINRRVG